VQVKHKVEEKVERNQPNLAKNPKLGLIRSTDLTCPGKNYFLEFRLSQREKVRTTKIRTSKAKNKNIECQKFVKGSDHRKSPFKLSECQKITTTTTTY
jgi:hypothetical protein